MLDDHGQRAYAIVELNIRLDHASIFDRGNVVHVDIASKFQLGVPDFHYSDLGRRYAHDSFHAICEN